MIHHLFFKKFLRFWPSSNCEWMADIAYGSIGRNILFHILRYSPKEIHRLSNISLCNVEGNDHLIWQTSHLIWQRGIPVKVPAQCNVNVNGVDFWYWLGGRTTGTLGDEIFLGVRRSWPWPHSPPVSVFSSDFGYFILQKSHASIFQKKLLKLQKSLNIGGLSPRSQEWGTRPPRPTPWCSPMYRWQAEFRNFIKCHKVAMKTLFSGQNRSNAFMTFIDGGVMWKWDCELRTEGRGLERRREPAYCCWSGGNSVVK